MEQVDGKDAKLARVPPSARWRGNPNCQRPRCALSICATWNGGGGTAAKHHCGKWEWNQIYRAVSTISNFIVY